MPKMFSGLLVLLCLCARISALDPAAGNGLIRIGGQRMNLVLDAADGTGAIRDRFVSIIQKATGVRPSLSPRLNPRLRNCVFHFLSPEQSAAMGPDDPDAVYFIRMDDGKHLYFGKNVGYAVYDFLKRYAGYREFGGMKEEIVIPKIECIDLPEKIRIEEKPDIPSYIAGGTPVSRFGRSDRMRSKATHSFWRILPPEKYGKRHPEYYPLIDGVRRVPASGIQAGWQPCLANPDLPDIIMRYADDYFTEHPAHFSLPLGVNDSAGDCLCEFCDGRYRAHGNQYAEFYNRMAKLLAERHPGKFLAFIAYGKRSWQAPRGIKMEPNIVVEVIGPNEGEMKKWKDAGVRHFGIYDYLYTAGNGFVVPRYFPRRHAALWKHLHRKYGLLSIFSEYSPCETVIEGARQYVLDELAWNMEADPDALLTDYFRSMFEQAAAPVSRFYERLEEIAVRDPNVTGLFLIWRNPAQLRFFTAEDLAFLDRSLAEAEKIRVPAHVEVRLHRLRKFYTLFRAYAALSISVNALGKIMPDSREGCAGLLAELHAACSHLADIESFSLPEKTEFSIFYPARMNLKKFNSQYNLNALSMLETVADQALNRVTAFLRKEGSDVSVFWKKQAESCTSSREKAFLLSQIYSDPEKKPYILNGSFEEGGKASLTNWSVWRSSREETQIGLSDSEHFEGRFSLRTGRNVNDAIIYTWPIAVKPFERYHIVCHVKRTGSPVCSRPASIALKTASNGSIIAACVVPSSAAEGWIRLDLYATIPENLKQVCFTISPPVQNDGSAFYADGVSMRRIYAPGKDEIHADGTMMPESFSLDL